MPFTFSHPAAAVPLARWLPLSALVAGSMSPDFIYFMQLRASGDIGHTLPGLFTFCLPTSLALLWLWHRVMKAPAAALLPPWLRARVLPAAAKPFSFSGHWVPMIAGILLGAVTHVVWDAFTHVDGWVVLRTPWLQGSVPFPGFGTMPIAKLNQLLSTAVGAALLAWWAWRWVQAQPPAPVPPAVPHRGIWAVALVLGAAAAGVGYASWQAAPLDSYLNLRYFVVQAIVTCVSALWLGLLGFAVWCRATGILADKLQADYE